MDLLINIDVPDLAAAVRFYENGLGFRVRRHLFEGTAPEISLGAVRVFLLEQSDGSLAVPGSGFTRSYTDHWTPVHLDIVVDTLEAATARALAAGARVSDQPRDRDWGRFAPMRDPFGHGFCLLEFGDSDYDLVEVQQQDAVANRPGL